MNKYEKALIESVDRKDKENYKNLKELVDRAQLLKPKVKRIECYYGEYPSEYEYEYKCPTCGSFVGNEYHKDNFCSYCGQAIDNSDLDDLR